MRKVMFSLVFFAVLFAIPVTNVFATDTDYQSSKEEEASNLDVETKFEEINKPANAKIIKASKNTSVNLEEAYWYVNEKGEEVQVTKIKVSQKDRGKTYDISIDQKTNEYIVTETNSSSSPLLSIMNTTYFIGATYTTNDPIYIALNRSRHELTWGGNSTDAWKVSRFATAWAANPSSLGTHWYISSNKYEGYIDHGNYIRSSSYHSYYNYDFGDNSQRTDVWHRFNIEGQNTGMSYITVERGKSGEGSSLLSFKLSTY